MFLLMFQVRLLQEAPFVLGVLAKLILVVLCLAFPRQEEVISPTCGGMINMGFATTPCIINATPAHLENAVLKYRLNIPALVQWN